MGTWFATREDIRSALDASDAARSDAQLDRALDAASRAVVGLCNRTFVPTLATRYFDWPQEQTPRSWRLWLDQYDLITVTQILSAGTEVPSTDYYLEPANEGPPYTYIETRLDKPSVWSTGGTWQHAIGITGWWGYTDDQVPAGALAAAISSTTGTAVTVTDSSLVGVGHLLSVGNERMTVTDKALASTGQTLQADLTDLNNDVQVHLADGTAVHKGETLTVDAERMLVTDVAGNIAIVERGYDGSVLATHTTGASVYAPRLLTVARAAAGTTTATASDGAALTRWAPPGLVHTLTVAEAVNWLLQEQAGYLRTVGGGERGGKEATLDALKDLRDQCYVQHGRKARLRVV